MGVATFIIGGTLGDGTALPETHVEIERTIEAVFAFAGYRESVQRSLAAEQSATVTARLADGHRAPHRFRRINWRVTVTGVKGTD